MVRTYKFEYIITIISLSLLVSIAWYYLYLMASHPSMDGMMKSENSMSMSMDSIEMDSVQMNSMSMESMEMNNGNKSINFLMMPSTYIFLNLFRLMRSKMQTVKYPTLELSLISLTYFIIWIIFSISACTAQYYLHNNGLVDMMGTLKSNTVSSITLLVAGIYQFTNLKQACLEKCRNPLSFIMGRNIHGTKDIISIGLSHGLYCLGCCWSLMALLFVNGVMNLTWVVILTIIILIEKLLPFEQLSSRFFGVLLVIWGLYLLI